MADINDFKLLNKISKNYFDTLLNTLQTSAVITEIPNINDLEKSRLGFYLFMISQITNLSDYTDVYKYITDTDFNKKLFNDICDDYGVDAIFIDEENKDIKLFNFKFREKFKSSTPSPNETIATSKFLNALRNDDIKKMKGKVKKYAKEILEKYNSSDIWTTTLYVISNENFQSGELDEHITQFKETFGLNVKEFGLDEIRDFLISRPTPINAKITLDSDAVMTFTDSNLSSSKSYVFRITLSELIRITSDDESLRNLYNIEHIEDLAQISLDLGILYDNVRGYVLKSKFNKNISISLKDRPNLFFLFNNGLTIIADNIVAKEINGGNKVNIELQNFQVINGGQTLKTLHLFNKEDSNHITDYLNKAQVLLRVFKTESDSELNSLIAEYTNSQNTISVMDLKSLRPEQLKLEKLLDEHDILYSRKSGDTGSIKLKPYRIQISMEKFGQILMSHSGHPEKATNDKKSIFDKEYNSLFIENTLLLDKAVGYIENFEETKKTYELLRKNDKSIDVSDQKIFYIIYINNKIDLTTEESIQLLERSIKAYKPPTGKNVSDARKLIQGAFKTFLDSEIEALQTNK